MAVFSAALLECILRPKHQWTLNSSRKTVATLVLCTSVSPHILSSESRPSCNKTPISDDICIVTTDCRCTFDGMRHTYTLWGGLHWTADADMISDLLCLGTVQHNSSLLATCSLIFLVLLTILRRLWDVCVRWLYSLINLLLCQELLWNIAVFRYC